MDDLEIEERRAAEEQEQADRKALVELKERERGEAMMERWHGFPLPDIPEGASFEEMVTVFERLAVETLAQVAYNPHGKDAARVAAANAILDRARGKPMQETKVSVDNISFISMLDDMLQIRKGVYIDEGAIEAEVID